MKLQQLMSYTRRAIDDYNMIQDRDRIAIGISGGKDSLTLLYALHGLHATIRKNSIWRQLRSIWGILILMCQAFTPCAKP